MNNTCLRLNVFYRVIPYDRGFRFDEEVKTKNPLIPDDVIIRLLELKSLAQYNFDEFDSLYECYRVCEDCYVGIPCPDIEGFSFCFRLKDGSVVSWKVSDNQ